MLSCHVIQLQPEEEVNLMQQVRTPHWVRFQSVPMLEEEGEEEKNRKKINKRLEKEGDTNKDR